MPVLVLKKVDSDQSTATFNIGEHIVGRGPQLFCDSKKVSRKHGELRITKSDGVFLRAIHNNPCFHRSRTLKNVTILTYGKTIQINNEDLIALSLDHGWFKVQIQNENETTVPKRKNENESDEMVNKKVKIENVETDEIATRNEAMETVTGTESVPIKTEPLGESSVHDMNQTQLLNQSEIKTEIEENGMSIKQEITDKNPPEIKTEVEESGTSIEQERLDENPTETTTEIEISETDMKQEIPDRNSSEIKIETETSLRQETTEGNLCQISNGTEETEIASNHSDATREKEVEDASKDKASSSGTSVNRVWRDRCWYGSSCYRKNAAHRATFSHAGDSDYDSDPNDSRPICCYGADCYRRNKDHRKRYRHPGQNKLPKPPQRQNLGCKVTTKAKWSKNDKASATYSDSEDSYDYSDPFLNDGSSSDEYAPSDTSETESEYEDEDNSQSQEDRKHMLHEAKKFIKKK